MESFVTTLLTVLGAYLAAGFIFAVVFAFKGASKIDPSANGGSWGFKLAIIPASAVFWPMLVRRWAKGTGVPQECSPHRKAAGGCGGCGCGKKASS